MQLAILLVAIAILLGGAGGYFHLRRILRRIMSQDTDLGAIVTQLTTDVAQAIADIQTVLTPAQSDPAVAAAILQLKALDGNVQAADANIKAVINPPAPPASGQGIPNGSGTVTPTP